MAIHLRRIGDQTQVLVDGELAGVVMEDWGTWRAGVGSVISEHASRAEAEGWAVGQVTVQRLALTWVRAHHAPAPAEVA